MSYNSTLFNTSNDSSNNSSSNPSGLPSKRLPTSINNPQAQNFFYPQHGGNNSNNNSDVDSLKNRAEILQTARNVSQHINSKSSSSFDEYYYYNAHHHNHHNSGNTGSNTGSMARQSGGVNTHQQMLFSRGVPIQHNKINSDPTPLQMFGAKHAHLHNKLAPIGTNPPDNINSSSNNSKWQNSTFETSPLTWTGVSFGDKDRRGSGGKLFEQINDDRYTDELDAIMKQHEEDIIKSLNLNCVFDASSHLVEPQSSDLLWPSHYNDTIPNTSDRRRSESNCSEADSRPPPSPYHGGGSFSSFMSNQSVPTSQLHQPGKLLSVSGFNGSSAPMTGNINTNTPNPYPNGNANLKQLIQFRNTYVSWCERLKIVPAAELLRAIKLSMRNQTPFMRLSICHAGVDDTHIKAIVQALQIQDQVNEILLNHNIIGDSGAQALISILKDSKPITSVELFGNRIGDAACADISELLKCNTALKRVKLGDNLIGPKGAEMLAEGLKNNTTLTQLHLGGNKIQVEGLKHLAEALNKNTTLTSLGLRDNIVGPDGMQALSETLQQPTCALSDIQLKGNNILPQGAMFLAFALNTNTSLKVLELQSNKIGPLGVKALCSALKENRSVHALNFNDNELGDEGAESIAKLLQNNPSITTLGLANNRIRKRGTISLSEALKSANTAVTGLDLGNNELGNGGAVALADALKVNTVLTSLDLRGCEIHLKGILSLAEMAAVNTSLRHLDLGANYAKNQGAMAWAAVLSNNSSLTRLCLTDNQIYHEGGEALAHALQTNQTLRNFSYGGQGPSANRIDSTIRRIIDSIVAENKRRWETTNISGGGNSSVPTPTLPNLMHNYSFKNMTPNTPHSNPFVSMGVNSGTQNMSAFMSMNGNSSPATPSMMNNANGASSLMSPHNPVSPYFPSTPNYNPYEFVPSSPSSRMHQYYMQMGQNSNTFVMPDSRASFNGLPGWFAGTNNMGVGVNNNQHGLKYPVSPQVNLNSPNVMYFPSPQAHVMDPRTLDSRLEFLFQNKLLKAENPKFPGCYFIGNIVNTLRKIFPDTRIDEVQLAQFAYYHPKYYVHLSREMVKTQIKYLGDQPNQTNPHQRSNSNQFSVVSKSGLNDGENTFEYETDKGSEHCDSSDTDRQSFDSFDSAEIENFNHAQSHPNDQQEFDSLSNTLDNVLRI